MQYILDQVRQIEGIEEKRREAERLLDIFDCPGIGEIPGGYIVVHPFERKYSDAIEELDLYSRPFFDELASIFGDNSPEIFQKLMTKFERNYNHMLELAGMEPSDLYNLPTHKTFPFFDDFDGYVRMSKVAWSNISLTNLTFTPNFVGKGAFADVYQVSDNDGNKYALKLFRRKSQMKPFLWELYSSYINHILRNVKKNKELFSQKPFAAPRACTNTLQSCCWYLMDFSEGESVQDKLDNGENLVKDKELTERILLTYANMLKMLHSFGKLFMDNSWSCVLINDDEIAICDYDLIASSDDPENGTKFIAGHTPYRSRETIWAKFPSPSSELESFALMIDHLFFGKPIITTKNERNHKRSAKQNKREYPLERKGKLTPMLEQIVPPLITYPRDDSITIDDFISAIKQDFKT